MRGVVRNGLSRDLRIQSLNISSILAFSSDANALSCLIILDLIECMDVTERTLGAYIICKRCSSCKNYDIRIQGNTFTKYEEEFIRRMMNIDEVKDAKDKINEMNKLINFKKMYTDDISMHMASKMYKALGLAYLIFSPYHRSWSSNKQYIDDLISIDKVNSIPYDYETIEKVIDRCKYLEKNYSDLWNLYLLGNYRSVYFEKIYANFHRTNMEMVLLSKCTDIFPHLEAMDCVKYNTHKTINLKDINNIRKLGFNPPDLGKKYKLSDVFDRYNLLEDETKRSKFINEQKIITKNKLETYHKSKIRNVKNLTTMEPIENFYWFDILECADDKSVYFFTIDDCFSINRTGINPYTNSPISRTFRSIISTYLHENIGLNMEYINTIEDCIESLYNLPTLSDVIESNRSIPVNMYGISDDNNDQMNRDNNYPIIFIGGLSSLYITLLICMYYVSGPVSVPILFIITIFVLVYPSVIRYLNL